MRVIAVVVPAGERDKGVSGIVCGRYQSQGLYERQERVCCAYSRTMRHVSGGSLCEGGWCMAPRQRRPIRSVQESVHSGRRRSTRQGRAADGRSRRSVGVGIFVFPSAESNVTEN